MEMSAKLRRLIDSLTDSTLRGAVTWKATGELDWYLYDGGSGAVVVGSMHNDGQWPHGIRVLDEDGVEVTSFAENWVDDGHEGYQSTEVTNVYHAAKDAEVRFAGVIDSLLAGLERVPAHA